MGIRMKFIGLNTTDAIIQRNPLLLQLPRSPEMVCALTEAKEELQKLLSSCFPPPVVTSAAHEYLLILQQLTNSYSTLTGMITAKLCGHLLGAQPSSGSLLHLLGARPSSAI